MPATKAATNPFPPIAIEPAYASIASARIATCSETCEVHPRSVAAEKTAPPRTPTTSAAANASAICSDAFRSHHPAPIPSSEANSARNNARNGVASPSLSPLSTFSARRMRTGTAGSVKTARPSAASVGARIVPMTAAAAQPSAWNIRPATSVPRAIVSGSPSRSSRPGSWTSPSTSRNLTVEASANSKRASVSSVNVSEASSPIRNGRTFRTLGPSSKPAVMNTIGAVIDQRSSFEAVSA